MAATFDPNQPFEIEAPASRAAVFDPNAPFEVENVETMVVRPERDPLMPGPPRAATEAPRRPNSLERAGNAVVNTVDDFAKQRDAPIGSLSSFLRAPLNLLESARLPLTAGYNALNAALPDQTVTPGGLPAPARPGVMDRVTHAMGSAFEEPMGPSDQYLGSLVTGPDPLLNTLNRSLVQAPLTAADALIARPFMAATRGASALVGGLGEKFGMEPGSSDRLERDLNTAVDAASIGLGVTPTPRGLPKPVELGKPTLAQRAAELITGANPEELARVSKLSSEGYRVSPSFADLPRAHRIVDIARVLGYDPTGKSATKLARDRSIDILIQQGKTPEEAEVLVNKLRGPYTPTMEDASVALTDSAGSVQSRIDSNTSVARAGEDFARETAAADVEAAGARAGNIKTNILDTQIARTAKERADHLNRVNGAIQDDFINLENVRKNTDPGDLATTFPEKLQETRRNIGRAFNDAYDNAISIAGDAKIDSTTAAPAVVDFLRDMPDSFKANQPALMRAVAKIADPELGGTVTLPELQWLRTQLRDSADFQSLPSNVRNGSFKYFSGIVDNLIHDPDAPSQWRKSVSELDHVDTLYKKNMAIWRDKEAQHLVDQTRAGVAPDPVTVAQSLNEPTQTARRRELLRLAGPEMKEKVWSATIDDLINGAMAEGVDPTTVTGASLRYVDPGKFMAGVMKLNNSGALRDYAGADAGKIVVMARRLAQRDGKIELNPAQDGGFVRSLQKANAADEALQKLVKTDPASILLAESEKAAKHAEEIRNQPSAVVPEENPMGFMLEPSRSAIAVTESLLHPDNVNMLRNTIKTLGEDSDAVKLLREQATEYVLKPFLDIDPKTRRIDPEKALSEFRKLSKNTQELIFPGVREHALSDLATEMRTLIGDSSKTAASIGGGAIVGQKSWKNYIQEYAWYRGAAYVLTHPKFISKLLEGFSGDINAVTKAKEDFRTAVNGVMEAAVRIGAPATMDERQKMPSAARGPAEVVPWQQRMQDRTGNQRNWQQQMQRPPGFALGGSVNADLLPLFQSASEETGVPLPVLLAVAKQESNFDPKVTSSTGGRGIMQVQPSTAAKPGFGVEAVNPDSLYDPATNISFGAKYLAAMGRSAGVKDWNDPNEAAKGLLRYNGGGDPNYVKNVGRYLSGYENVQASSPTVQMAQADEPVMDDTADEPVDYEVSEDTPVSSDIQQDENSIMGLPSYVWAILDPAYKKQLLQMGVNNGTVSEKQAMALLNVRPAFAEGGIVEAFNPSTAEPQLDTDAQMQAVQDPQAGKDTMFIAKGSQYPQDIPVGTIIVRRPEGDLVTTSLEKAAEFLQTPQLTDRDMAALLGYPEAKSEAIDPVVVQGVEPSGGVSTEMLSSPDKTEEAVKAVLKQSPTAALGILSPDQAQQRRRVAMMGGMV